MPSGLGIGIGVAMWGQQFTQGLLAPLIAETAPAELRGTAFGMFNLATGAAILLASVIAGALWDIAGPQGTFFAGATIALVTLAGLSLARTHLTTSRQG